MKAILGIGNPGTRYDNTRHNIGFIILDVFAKKYNLDFKPAKGEYFFTGSKINASPFILCKPTTYVNLTGRAVLEITSDYNIDTDDILIVVDDINLELGNIRLRFAGGDGGHNGLNSILYELNTDQFARLRFGTGNNFEKGEMANYVLDKFSADDFNLIKNNINFSVKLIEQFIIGGYKKMTDTYSLEQNKQSKNINKLEGN